MQTKTKFVALTLGLAMVFGVAAPASAVTIAELQAQIEALMAQLAALQGGANANTSYTFTQNLTVGSTGADVTSLQQFLVGGGYLNMPTGVSYGYFGPLTKAAVASWQAAKGISPAVGYWGPISRAAANAMGPSTPGTTTPGSTVGISTPGVEGTITVTKNPSPASGAKVYEGGSKTSVLGIKIEAKTSDMRVERVKLDLDETGDTATADAAFYNKFAEKIYVMDGSTVLASADLNSSTVVEESGEISITLAGMGVVVPKDTTKVLTIALDAKSSWDSTYDNDTWTVGVPLDGVRSIDGAGVNQYGPSVAFSNSVTGAADILESSTLAIATAGDTPITREVIAAQGTSENEYDGLELLKFTARAEKDDVKITDAVVSITRGVGTVATATTAYIYDGSTLVGSATVAGTSATDMTATFTDIDYVVSKDVTKTFTVKVDIDSADSTGTTFVAAIAATTGITAERPNGDAVAETGSATGEASTIRNAGPEFTIKSASTSYTAAASLAGATSTAKATFVVNIKAVGGDIYFGTQAASSTFQVGTWKGGVNSGADYVNASTTSYVIPSSGVITTGLSTGQAFKLAENTNVDVTIETIFPGRLSTGALLGTDAYAFGIKKIVWSVNLLGAESNSTFMDGKTSWRTSTVVLP